MNRHGNWRCAPSQPGLAQRLPTVVAPAGPVCPIGRHSAHDQPHDRLASSNSASTSGRSAQPSRERSRRHVVVRCSKQLTFHQRPQHTVQSSHAGSDNDITDSQCQLAVMVAVPSHISTNGHSSGSLNLHHQESAALHSGHTEAGFLDGMLNHEQSLINQIERSRDVDQLNLVLHATLPDLGPQHLRAALVHLALLVKQQPKPGADPACVHRTAELVTAALLRCSEPLAPQQLTDIAISLASLRYYPQPLLLRLLHGIAAQPNAFTPLQASQLLCALGRLHRHCKLVVDVQLVPLLLTWQPSASDHSPEDTCSATSALCGCALLRQPPPGPWMEAFLSHALTRMAQLPQAQLSQVLWSLAVLGCDPGRSWVERALERLSGRLELSSGTEVASVLWALATLQHAPNAAWMGHFLWQVQRLFSRCSAQQLSLISWSLASLQYRPEANWVRKFLRELVHRMQGKGRAQAQAAEAVRPQFVATSLWALAKLQIQPDSRMLLKVAAAMQPLLPASTPRDLALLAWSLQRFSFLPDALWMAEAQVAMHARVGQFDLASVILLLVALKGYSHVSASAARLGKRNLVDSQLVSLLCMRLESLSCQRDAALSARSTMTLLLTLGKLQAPISRELHGYLLQQTSSHLEDIPVWKLPVVCWSICKLACGNGDSRQLRGASQLRLLPRIEAAVRAHLASPGVCVKDLLQLGSGLASVAFRPGEEWLRLHEAAAARLVRQGRVRPSIAAMLLQAYGRLGHEPPALAAALRSSSMQVLEAMQAPAGDASPAPASGARPAPASSVSPASPGAAAAGSSYSTADLLHFLSGFAAVAFHPGEEWLRLHEGCAAALARGGRVAPWAALALVQGYARLGFDARRLRAELQVVRIGERSFAARDEACTFFAELLGRAPAGTSLTRDSKLLLALLQHHPNAAGKVGVGVSGFQVRHIEDSSGAPRAFFVLRTDGSMERFSYVKCCTAAFSLASAVQEGAPRRPRRPATRPSRHTDNGV